jgi:hypothetical protein
MSAISFARARRVERNRPTRCRRSSTARGSSSTYGLQATFRQPTRRRRFSLIRSGAIQSGRTKYDQCRTCSRSAADLSLGLGRSQQHLRRIRRHDDKRHHGHRRIPDRALQFMTNGCLSIWARFAQARQDQRGISAVEFALILPFMLTLYLGIVELSKGYMASQRMTLVARTLADLTAQQQQLQSGGTTNVTETIMTNIFAASNAIMAPYSTTKLTMTVSQILLSIPGSASRSGIGRSRRPSTWRRRNICFRAARVL